MQLPIQSGSHTPQCVFRNMGLLEEHRNLISQSAGGSDIVLRFAARGPIVRDQELVRVRKLRILIAGGLVVLRQL